MVEQGYVFEDIFGAEYFGLLEIHLSFLVVEECWREDHFCYLGDPLLQLFLGDGLGGTSRKVNNDLFVSWLYLELFLVVFGLFGCFLLIGDESFEESD